MIVFLGVWGWISYYGLNNFDAEWYWSVGIGFIAGYIVFWLFRGPLRFVGTLVKYLIGLAFLGFLVYGIVEIIKVLA